MILDYADTKEVRKERSKSVKKRLRGKGKCRFRLNSQGKGELFLFT